MVSLNVLEGLGFRVQGLGFRAQGAGVRVWDSCSSVLGAWH